MSFFNLQIIKDLTVREALRLIINRLRALEVLSVSKDLSGTHNQRPHAEDLEVGVKYTESDRLHTYEVIAVGDNKTGKAWSLLEGVGGPYSGTLLPDTKPTDLGLRDEGFRFFSTDYAREYRWTGSMWFDAPGAPARWMISHFDHPPEPIAGWILCDGGVAYRRSTENGTTEPYAAPDLITLANRFLRSSSVADGGITDGFEEHNHVINDIITTSSPSDTTEVPAPTGAVVRVASDSHTHLFDMAGYPTDIVNHLPPYYNAAPYIRV